MTAQRRLTDAQVAEDARIRVAVGVLEAAARDWALHGNGSHGATLHDCLLEAAIRYADVVRAAAPETTP